MLQMKDIMLLSELKQQGLSNRAISRQTGRDRKTVAKYLDRGLKVPRYKPRSTKPGKLDPYKEYIRGRLDGFPQLTGTRLYREIRDRGYEGRYTILIEYVRTIRPSPPVAFERRFETPPGEQAQVDFAAFQTVFTSDPGTTYKLHLFLFVMGYSRWFWGLFGGDQKLLTVMRGHNGAFQALGGAPRTILYDRMKTAVIDSDQDGRPIYNQHLLGLLDHYQVTPRACRPYRAKTKGKVERLISMIRKDFFYAREFVDMDDLNRQFALWCMEVANTRRHGTTRRIVADDLVKERPHLIPLPPHPYDEAIRMERKVNREGMISVDTNHYSVPTTTTSRVVDVHIGPSTLRLFSKGELIATHPRLEGKHQRRLDPLHRRSPPPEQLSRISATSKVKDGGVPLRIPTRSLALYAAIGEGLSQTGGAQ